MNIKVNFDNIKVKETKKDFTVKILMLKGEKGEQGDLNPSHIVDNLTSNDSSKVLSAKQGKVLKDLVDKKPYYFDTVADMKSADLSAGDMAITKGYYSVNDGGAGQYEIVNTQSQTEYQETLNNGLYATLIIENDTINTKQVGCKADGITDDRNNLIKAFNICYNVEFSEGTYLISSDISTSGKDLNIKGNNSKIINFGLRFKNCDIKIEKLKFENCYLHGMHIENCSGYIKKCNFYNISTRNENLTALGGIYVEKPQGLTIEENSFEKCHGYGALYVHGLGMINIYNNYFNDNDYRALNLIKAETTDYLEGNIFYNYINDCGKSNTSETGGVGCNGMYIPSAIKMKVNYNTIINSRENAIEGYFQECCYN